MRRQCCPMRAIVARSLQVSSDCGHDLQHASLSNGRSMFVCRTCGCFAMRQFRKLVNVCRGKSSRTHVWRSIFLRLKHPSLAGVSIVSIAPVRPPKVWNRDSFDLSLLFGDVDSHVVSRAKANKGASRGPNAGSGAVQRDPLGLDDPDGDLVSLSD